MKVLVRNNEESTEILDDSEFISTALDQMSTTAASLKDVTESEQLLNGMADILELMQEVLSKNNINPMLALQHASQLRESTGSFNAKKAVEKE